MDLLGSAFKLAYFLHRDEDLAERIAVGALTKMVAAIERQGRRSSYRVRRRRTKAALSDAQLLQCLVYLESEPYEKERERHGNVREDDLVIWSIKRLIQITMERNALHVALGVCRFLYRYSTRETVALFDLLAQDPECRFEEDYCRARKKVLLRELVERFESRVELHRGPHREEMPRTREASARHLHLVRECLEEFTPWGTRCVIPERWTPLHDSEPPCRSEIHRIHTVVHPPCFARLTRALGMDPPEKRLVVLRFRGPSEPTTAAGSIRDVRGSRDV